MVCRSRILGFAGEYLLVVVVLAGVASVLHNIQNVISNRYQLVETRKDRGELPFSSQNGTKFCPEYFKYIKEDLKPWIQLGGIPKKSILFAQQGASFRVQIIKNNVFVQHYGWCYQTRAAFTVWAILQLLQRYPNEIPDVDLMFHCMDTPLVKKTRFQNHTHPPLLLKYCSSADHLDVVWPDWSFWGWPEVKISNWEKTRQKISQKSSSIPWNEKIPLGQWKGAVWVAPHIRGPIVDCNDEPNHKWKVITADKNWVKEIDEEDSRLENQCNYKYKIYVEGTSWSCSLKYIMACNSTVLLVRPTYFDFFSRSLKNGTHYIDIPPPTKGDVCENFKSAIENAESHPEETLNVANRAAAFTSNELDMSNVYDYMFHFLRLYGQLQKFTPKRVKNAKITTLETVYSDASEAVRPFMELESYWKDTKPCVV